MNADHLFNDILQLVRWVASVQLFVDLCPHHRLLHRGNNWALVLFCYLQALKSKGQRQGVRAHLHQTPKPASFSLDLQARSKSCIGYRLKEIH